MPKKPAPKVLPKIVPQNKLTPLDSSALVPTQSVRPVAFITIVFIPIIFVLVYALHPWFTLSSGATRDIIVGAALVFMLVMGVLLVYVVKLIVDLLLKRQAALDQDKRAVSLLGLFLFSVLFFTTLLFLIQPSNL